MEQIIVITTQNTMFSRILPDCDRLHSFQKAVGGYIQTLPTELLDRKYTLLCNEEGLLLSLPINRTGCRFYHTERHGFPVCGDIAIAKIGFSNGEPDIVGLNESDVESLMKEIKSMMGETVKRIADPDTAVRRTEE